jgi:PKD repeat protein
MENKYKLVLLAAFATATMSAQQIIPCATDEAMKELFAKDPAAKARFDAYNNQTPPAEFTQRLGNNSTNSVYYAPDTVPVVFHVLHQGGAENITNAQVAACLVEVNKIHMKTNSDTTGVDAHFQSIIGRNNYFFKLATKDPSGNCTDGVIRHFDTNTDWSQASPGYNYTGTTAGKWNPTKYLNIYIVREICSSTAPCSQSGGIVVGYTYIPGTWPLGNQHDAIVYNYQFMTGTNARSLAHEIGHWFGLAHTFGSTNTPGTCLSGGASDDYLANGAAGAGVTDDTPKYYGAFSTCPPSTPNTCDVSNYGNVQNIMDYSSCPKMFTDGQTHRMHNTMALTTVGRNNVCSAANKIATGVRYPSVCVPIANFHPTARIACVGTIITFSDSSSNAHATAWNWSFTGGTFQGGTTATDSMPQVSYSLAGTYAVSYTASTSAGSNSITKTSYITINPNVATHNTAFFEGFETAALPNADWSLYSNIGPDWAITSMGAATGTKSAFVDNYANTSGNNSHLISTGFDISSFIAPKLTFKMAYQQQTSTDNDKFQVFTSVDCGNTWNARYTKSGAALATVTPASGLPLSPTPGQFTTYTVNINGVAGSTNVRFKFEFFADPTATGGIGNYIYLDDINLFDATTQVQAIEAHMDLEIYPNPSNGNVTLDFNLTEKHNVAVTVTDLLGRAVESVPAKQYAAGQTKIMIAEKTIYEAGVYLVNMNVDGTMITKKIIIK